MICLLGVCRFLGCVRRCQSGCVFFFSFVFGVFRSEGAVMWHVRVVSWGVELAATH